VLKAALCRLLLSVYVDRDPYRVISLPRCYRDLASSSVDAVSGESAFPCSAFASDLAGVCAYTSSYFSSIRGATKLWKVSPGECSMRAVGFRRNGAQAQVQGWCKKWAAC
jgi:hypothetical protein